jgi:ADP-ribosylglycohydrolase
MKCRQIFARPLKPVSQQSDSIIGCLVGGAIGDAFGGKFEGRAAPVALPDDHEWRLSDDTQLTLATCEAITNNGGIVEPSAIAAAFVSWHRAGRFTGLGASTFKALSELLHGGHWALVGRKGERAAGNGAAMRIAPLAFCPGPTATEDRRMIRDVSRITHHHEEAYAGALAVAVAVRAAFDGSWQGDENLIQLVIDVLPDTNVRDHLIQLSAIEAMTLPEIGARFGCSGFVAESVPLAIYAAQQLNRLGFQAMMRELIMTGGDTDTTASIAGQIAGAMIGKTGLPEQMLNRLPERELIEKIAVRFAEAVMKTQQS